ncbi:uncharacterized protein LOC120778686 [Bactrocera tryoni]|uniref:uncharacterized protein LOC120778686 n=1 Tax=Bactrocera tryoni TaxID=59916 RepID=UPI001A995D04|nr:uncharacterized protein LOC120778686 [Bactrocera tryoni]
MDHKPLIYAFAQRSSRASPRQLNQLDYISQFTTEIVYIKGEENVVADALSRISAISMPTVLSAERIQHEQQEDEELQQLIRNNNNTTLKFPRLSIDENTSNLDKFSRWPVAVPLKDMTADVVCTAFYSNWITQFGTPLTITTDQGTQFESALFTALIRLIGAHLIRTTPYHPQSNELVERWHRTLKAALMYNTVSPWPEEVLPTVPLGLRTCYKEDLDASPADLYLAQVYVFRENFWFHRACHRTHRFSSRNFSMEERRLSPSTSTSQHTSPKKALKTLSSPELRNYQSISASSWNHGQACSYLFQER